MPVSLDRTDLAVLATWPELQERARFPLPSTELADGGRLQRFGVVDRRSCASRRGRLSSAEHVPVASEGLR
jgi:hypothetical protein